jgi:DNA-directed RNA polymerase subunit RPC12/RpoP
VLFFSQTKIIPTTVTTLKLTDKGYDIYNNNYIIAVGSSMLQLTMNPKYTHGFRYCSKCEKWFPSHYSEVRCKDCNTLLRYKPAAQPFKQRVNEAAGYTTRY